MNHDNYCILLAPVAEGGSINDQTSRTPSLWAWARTI